MNKSAIAITSLDHLIQAGKQIGTVDCQFGGCYNRTTVTSLLL